MRPATPSLVALYESLRPRLSAIDERRRRVRNLGIGAVACGLVGYTSCAMVLGGNTAGMPFPRQAPLVLGVLSVAAFGLAFSRFLIPAVLAWLNYRSRFKKDVMAELVATLHPGARYYGDRHLPRAVYEASGLYVTRASSFRGDDLIRGVVGETPFDLSELKASYETGTRERRRTVVVFRGLFFQIDLDRDLRGRTLLFPDPGLEPPENAGELQRVTTGDAAFDGKLAVWTTDRDEARELLSSRRRQALVAALETIGQPVRLAFVDRRVLGGIEYRSGLFEPKLTKRVGVEAFEAMARPLTAINQLVAALGLERGRRRPPDPEFYATPMVISDLEDATATEDLSVGKIAAEGGALGESRPTALPEGRTPPARVRTFGGELTVTYPLSPEPLVQLALSSALGVLALAAAASWAVPELATPLTADVQGRHSALAAAADLLVRYPGAATLVAASAWWVVFSRLRRRPATVTIGRQGIRIRRALRPWTEALPLSVVGRVTVSGRRVFVVRTDRGLWRSFVLVSPELGDEIEARWLAGKLRAGLALAGWPTRTTASGSRSRPSSAT